MYSGAPYSGAILLLTQDSPYLLLTYRILTYLQDSPYLLLTPYIITPYSGAILAPVNGAKF